VEWAEYAAVGAALVAVGRGTAADGVWSGGHALG